ncbi:MAG: hypothetical protein HY326_13195 [Chloroflexi bacterium]|nr:hypothetical protein [Chloroflexota bacterium]
MPKAETLQSDWLEAEVERLVKKWRHAWLLRWEPLKSTLVQMRESFQDIPETVEAPPPVTLPPNEPEARAQTEPEMVAAITILPEGETALETFEEVHVLAQEMISPEMGVSLQPAATTPPPADEPLPETMVTVALETDTVPAPRIAGPAPQPEEVSLPAGIDAPVAPVEATPAAVNTEEPGDVLPKAAEAPRQRRKLGPLSHNLPRKG